MQLGLRDIEQNESIDISFPVKLWQMPGCHELLASLSFDLMEVGRNEVTLRTGKQANKRNIQFALQALLALFGKLSHLAAKLANDLFKFYANHFMQIRHSRSTEEPVTGLIQVAGEPDVGRSGGGAAPCKPFRCRKRDEHVHSTALRSFIGDQFEQQPVQRIGVQADAFIRQ
jgi:hypothetical protein